jgi:hypothetical protein
MKKKKGSEPLQSALPGAFRGGRDLVAKNRHCDDSWVYFSSSVSGRCALKHCARLRDMEVSFTTSVMTIVARFLLHVRRNKSQSYASNLQSTVGSVRAVKKPESQYIGHTSGKHINV